MFTFLCTKAYQKLDIGLFIFIQAAFIEFFRGIRRLIPHTREEILVYFTIQEHSSMAGIDFILGKHKNIFRTISKILCSKIALSCLREQFIAITYTSIAKDIFEVVIR